MTHGVYMIYWEGMGVYGAGGGGPIVAQWRRSNFLMVVGSELKKMAVTEHCIFEGDDLL